MQKKVWQWTGLNEVTSTTAERGQPGTGEAEIRIVSIGICGTDLHIMSGHAGFGVPPLPLGHELAGVVERIGPGVDGWQPGDRVCIDPLIGCGVCRECLAGSKHRCAQSGEIGLHYPGGWQEYLVAPAANLYRLPDAVSFEEATQAETLHCCLGGIDKLDIRLGCHAAVIGDGPTGLYYVQLLKAAGASKVTLFGMRDGRLELGRRLGADVTVNLRSPDAAAAEPEAAETQDIAIDAAGNEASLKLCIDLLKRGGQLLLFGLPGHPILADIQAVVLKELTLSGSTNAPQVWPRVLELMASGSVQVKPLLSQRYPFEELDLAIAFARNEPDEAVKIIVSHS
ncbi:zinc-dependent alcohol dehydrogenase [Cohnella hashimotonis]|uniref:Alcohol dehydrogenase catalytic domain-containing protein n=1 Tax=Cohnella hashimotonis TaxID=2826895 RepID=A0ABT6TKH9_9BACL|nr:alcohol dehydrogenase catalytic domain-containing protein [Cohnella hashimotonis]MDI4647353.1 alcohol dehydrogenase catalytic domain-containing protein [Cohnella hashimotonis]